MAGLWEYWKPKDDPDDEYPDGLVTATVLTTSAVGPAARRCTTGCRWCCRRRPGTPGSTRTSTRRTRRCPRCSRRRRRSWWRAWTSGRSWPLVNSVRNNGPELLAAGPRTTPRRCSSTCSPGRTRREPDGCLPARPGRGPDPARAGPDHRAPRRRPRGRAAARPRCGRRHRCARSARRHPGRARRRGDGGARRAALPGRRPPRARARRASWTRPGWRSSSTSGGGSPLLFGGRSSGARVACRTATAGGAAGVLCLAFPVHPPGRPEKDRLAELAAPACRCWSCRGSATRSAARSRPRAGRWCCCAATTPSSRTCPACARR